MTHKQHIEPTFDIAQELERKSNDVLARILQDLGEGISSPSQASYALRVLFDATSGLVPKDLFDMISQASAEVEAERKMAPDMLVQLMLNPRDQEFVLLTYQYGEARVGVKIGDLPRDESQVNNWKKESVATFENEFNPFEVARQRFDSYAHRLAVRGFIKVNPC